MTVFIAEPLEVFNVCHRIRIVLTVFTTELLDAYDFNSYGTMEKVNKYIVVLSRVHKK